MVQTLVENKKARREAFLNHPDEKVRKARKAWLKRIDEEAKLPPPTVVEEEYEWAKEVVDGYRRFKCSFGRHPFWCDGYRCETDVYSECMEFLKANLMLHQIARGEIRVQWRTLKVRL